MKQIDIFFKNQKKLIVKIFENPIGDIFFQLVKNNLKKEKPIFRDHAKYNQEYLTELSIKLKKELNFNWIKENYSLENTVEMHKEIENLIEKDFSFKKIPGHLQNLIHEAHFCIHTIQYKKKNYPHGNFLQIEWFNDDFVDLKENFKFTPVISFGDVILQNPYVGHPPLQCYQQNDYKNILRTCTFHDRIKPGIKINLTNSNYTLNLTEYKNWWYKNAINFVDLHGLEKILYYTGFPVIGKIENLETLSEIIKTPILELDNIVL